MVYNQHLGQRATCIQVMESKACMKGRCTDTERPNGKRVNHNGSSRGICVVTARSEKKNGVERLVHMKVEGG